jgi:hypothetical protein
VVALAIRGGEVSLHRRGEIKHKNAKVMVQGRGIEHICKVNAVGGIVSKASGRNGATGVADCRL